MTRDKYADYCLKHCSALCRDGRGEDLEAVLVAVTGAKVVAPRNLPMKVLEELYWALLEVRFGKK